MFVEDYAENFGQWGWGTELQNNFQPSGLSLYFGAKFIQAAIGSCLQICIVQ